MKVLVVGSGGREHALAWKIAQSPLVSEVITAPGNAGTAEVGRNVEVAPTDIDGLVALAQSEGVGLVVVGPEDPLVLGIADRLRDVGIDTYGPGASGSRLEGSKVFSKEFLDRHRIPTAAWRRFDRAGAAKSYLENCKIWPQVIKADGLAAGKGVFVCEDAIEACAFVDQIMEERRLGDAGAEIVIEEFMLGRELSVHVMTDGQTMCLLEAVMDHKQVGEGDTGKNTGGMGVYSPVAFVNQRLMRQVEQRVLLQTLHALSVEGIEFRGTLFVGLMITEGGPRVLEFNCRFGDPETQAIMRRMDTDLLPYLVAVAKGELEGLDPPTWKRESCVGVVAACEGYPGTYDKGHVIEGMDAAGKLEDVVVFHGGTKSIGQKVVTNGGRVLCVTSLGGNLEEARTNAYEGYDAIEWGGKFCRRDIGLPRPKREDLMPEDDHIVGMAGGDYGPRDGY